jgi:hypothetical protein
MEYSPSSEFPLSKNQGSNIHGQTKFGTTMLRKEPNSEKCSSESVQGAEDGGTICDRKDSATCFVER